MSIYVEKSPNINLKFVKNLMCYAFAHITETITYMFL